MYHDEIAQAICTSVPGAHRWIFAVRRYCSYTYKLTCKRICRSRSLKKQDSQIQNRLWVQWCSGWQLLFILQNCKIFIRCTVTNVLVIDLYITYHSLFGFYHQVSIIQFSYGSKAPSTRCDFFWTTLVDFCWDMLANKNQTVWTSVQHCRTLFTNVVECSRMFEACCYFHGCSRTSMLFHKSCIV